MGKDHVVEKVHHFKMKAGRKAPLKEESTCSFLKMLPGMAYEATVCLPLSYLPNGSESQLLEDLTIIL